MAVPSLWESWQTPDSYHLGKSQAGTGHLTSTTLGQLVDELGERLQLLLVNRHQFVT
jgi:hypothetical protein